jgi:hypothetical protein
MSTISKVYTPRSENKNTITIAPEFADIDIADTYNQLVDRQNTTIGELLTPDVMPASELQANMDYRNAFKQGDTITAVNNFFNTLDNYINQPDFSLDAVLYWYQKATYSNKEITAYKSAKDHYNTFLLPNYIPGASLFAQNVANFTNHEFSYPKVVSDSIGIIANSKFIQLDNTLPLFDISQSYYGVPIPIAASTDNKISSITRNVMYNLSQKNTTIMRRNLMNIGYSNVALQQNIAADATTSHGCNLINDLPTFVRVNKILDQLKNKLATVFTQAKTFSFVQYLNNIGNTTALNLRDIFPLASSDMDFTVITSDANAAAAAAIAQQQANDAAAAQQITDQQYRIGVGDTVAGGNAGIGNIGSGGLQTDASSIGVNIPAGSGSSGGSTPLNVDALPSNLKPYAQDFINAGQKYNIDPNFLAAISINETGGGTSRAFLQGNNAMGISNDSGPLYSFSSVAASINQQAKSLANPNGYYANATTIGQIGNIYSPVGAANDFYGTNSSWIPTVGKIYNRLTGNDPNSTVIVRTSNQQNTPVVSIKSTPIPSPTTGG